MIHFTSLHNFNSYIMNYVPFEKSKSKVALTVRNNTIVDSSGEIVGIFKAEKK